MPSAPRPRRLALVAVLSAVLLGTGCTATVAGTPAADPAPAPTEGPGSDPVLWVDRVCGSLLTFTGPALAQPQFGDTPNLPGIKQKLTDYLNGIIAGLQQSRAQLGQVGRSPVGGGDEAVARINDVLTKLETDITGGQGEGRLRRPGRPAGVPRDDHRRREPARADQRAGRARRPQRLAPAAEGRGEGGELPAALGAGQQPAGLTTGSGRTTSRRTRVLPCAPCPRVAAVAVLRRAPARRGRATSRACSAARARSCASARATRRGCPSCWPTRRRAPVVVAACVAVGIDAEPAVTESGATAVRTAFRRDLVGLAQSVDPGRRQDGAGGNAAGRGRVAGVDGRGGSLGRPGRRPAARPARTTDPPGA